MVLSGQKTEWTLIFLMLTVLIILSAVPVLAQDQAVERRYLSITPGAETAFYSLTGPAFGGGLSLAYGNRISLGLKAVFFADIKSLLNVLELNVLFRYYFISSHTGPFIQFSGGPALFFRQDNSIDLPADWGIISAGVSLGWRFFIGKTFFIEPSIRGGYPYLGGAGLAAGVHF